MAFTLDYTTDRGKVRLLIADVDAANPLYNDDQVDGFISIAQDGHVKRAAAQALMAMAVNEVMVQKRIKILDLSTDGPAEAIQLRMMAKVLMDQAEDEETTGAFDWAEQVLDTTTEFERFWKENQRAS